jgi:hypothetical protein
VEEDRCYDRQRLLLLLLSLLLFLLLLAMVMLVLLPKKLKHICRRRQHRAVNFLQIHAE